MLTIFVQSPCFLEGGSVPELNRENDEFFLGWVQTECWPSFIRMLSNDILMISLRLAQLIRSSIGCLNSAP